MCVVATISGNQYLKFMNQNRRQFRGEIFIQCGSRVRMTQAWVATHEFMDNCTRPPPALATCLIGGRDNVFALSGRPCIHASVCPLAFISPAVNH